MTDKQLLEQALKALEYASSYCDTYDEITAIRARLEQPEQEPDYSICPTCGGMADDPIVPPEQRQSAPVQEPCNHNESVPATVCKRCLCIVPTPEAQPAPVQEPAERFAALIDAINYERQQAEKYFRLYEEACDIAQRRLNEIARLDSQLAAAQPAQEPVMIYHGGCTIDCGEHGHHNMEMLKLIPAGTKLYDRPVAQKPWVCLTPKEVHAIWSVVNPDWHTPRGAVSAIYEHIETKLKDKNA